jgi:hypothetical protein
MTFSDSLIAEIGVSPLPIALAQWKTMLQSAMQSGLTEHSQPISYSVPHQLESSMICWQSSLWDTALWGLGNFSQQYGKKEKI